MTNTEVRHEAQYNLMTSLQAAFYDAELPKEVLEEMSRQMARIEKLFGYEPYSFPRN